MLRLLSANAVCLAWYCEKNEKRIACFHQHVGGVSQIVPPLAVRCFGHVGKPLERNPSPRNLFEHVASDVSSSDFDFPIVGVLGGRAITISSAMVSLEGANSGDPSGDPLGILGGSESKTGDPGVLYPKKPKDSGGSCATSVPLYNIKR